MTTFTLMRLYIKMQSMPRMPLLPPGYTGTLYSTPLMDRYRFACRTDMLGATSRPEFIGATTNHFVKKGSIGSFNYRHFSTSASTDDVKKAEKERLTKNKFKLKTEETVKVMLVTETGSILAVTLIEANKIAKKKRLHLLHVVNDQEKPVRTEKQVYKLVSKLDSLNDEYANAESDAESSQSKDVSAGGKTKEQKAVFLKSNIGEHDINAKLNVMKKWITKGHRIRMVISQSGNSDAESAFSRIESGMTEVEGQIQQKILKANEIRFYIGPPKQSSKKPDIGKKQRGTANATTEKENGE